MAVGSEGQVHVTWMEGEQPIDLDVFYSHLAESKWSKPSNLSKADGISQRPQVAVDSLGEVHVVWYGNQDGFFELYHSRLVDGEWSKPANTKLVEWYITHNPGYSRRAAISADNAGGLHMVWGGMDDVPSPYALCQNVRHSYWDGTNWSKPDNVSRMQDMQAKIEDPTIDTDVLGNIHVSWEDRMTYGILAGTESNGRSPAALTRRAENLLFPASAFPR